VDADILNGGIISNTGVSRINSKVTTFVPELVIVKFVVSDTGLVVGKLTNQFPSVLSKMKELSVLPVFGLHRYSCPSLSHKYCKFVPPPTFLRYKSA
jgi:hypothetical protein